MTHVTSVPTIRVVGGIDTHKDLHMAAVVESRRRPSAGDQGLLDDTRRVSGVTPLDASARRARVGRDRRHRQLWRRDHAFLERGGCDDT